MKMRIIGMFILLVMGLVLISGCAQVIKGKEPIKLIKCETQRIPADADAIDIMGGIHDNEPTPAIHYKKVIVRNLTDKAVKYVVVVNLQREYGEEISHLEKTKTINPRETKEFYFTFSGDLGASHNVYREERVCE